MKDQDRTVSELSSLFRMIQVIPDADSVSRIYQMLLAFCTTWRTIGCERAFLLLVDGSEDVIRGHLAAEHSDMPDGADRAHQGDASFESLAKRVFENYEKIDASDLTLRARAFSVPVGYESSAVARAGSTGHPVLAEGKLSEFANDPFFEFFTTRCYIAVPIRTGQHVIGVLAADNGVTGAPISVEDVSMVHSLTHQASLSVERLLEANESRRRFRILRKLQDILKSAESISELGESLNLSLSMICRAVGANGCVLRDYVRNKTLHIKAVNEYTMEANDTDIEVGQSFDRILDRCAGGMRPLSGDSGHPLLSDAAQSSIRLFHAVPLIVTGDGLGAMAVYKEKNKRNRSEVKLEGRNRTFLELCAGMIADRLGALHLSGRVDRAESILEDVRANLVREKDASRMGERALAYQQHLSGKLEELRDCMFSRLPFEKRVNLSKAILESIEKDARQHSEALEQLKSELAMTPLYSVVEEVVKQWAPGVSKRGIEVTVRIPRGGPELLMNRSRVSAALRSILASLSDNILKDDRVLIECSATDDKAVVLIADTGSGMPGDLLSRLFMPFGRVEESDDRRGAMSLAGDIIHRHSGEITVKSSPSWKTILIISFPIAGNRDRRQTRKERRRRRDRRLATAS